jgi:hypothetical protein
VTQVVRSFGLRYVPWVPLWDRSAWPPTPGQIHLAEPMPGGYLPRSCYGSEGRAAARRGCRPVPRGVWAVAPAVSTPHCLRGTRQDLPAPAWGNPAPYGWRAISVPLALVMGSLSRSVAEPFQCRPGRYEARTVQLPKLTARVRFPSPAPTKKAPGRNRLFGLRQLLRGVNARPYPLRSAPMMWRSRFSSSSSVGELE